MRVTERRRGAWPNDRFHNRLTRAVQLTAAGLFSTTFRSFACKAEDIEQRHKATPEVGG